MAKCLQAVVAVTVTVILYKARIIPNNLKLHKHAIKGAIAVKGYPNVGQHYSNTFVNDTKPRWRL